LAINIMQTTPRTSCCQRFCDHGLAEGISIDKCVLPYFQALDASFDYGSASDRK